MAVKLPRKQPGQFMLQRISQIIQAPRNHSHAHRIPGHVGVPGDREADVAVKDATSWRESTRYPNATCEQPEDTKTAVETKIFTRAKENWNDTNASSRVSRSYSQSTEILLAIRTMYVPLFGSKLMRRYVLRIQASCIDLDTSKKPKRMKSMTSK